MFSLPDDTLAGVRRPSWRDWLNNLTALSGSLIALLLAQAIFAQAVNAESGDRPNVVLIMTDDQGWGDLHFHGNAKLDTPNLDALALRSVRFDRFFVSPVCAPTRASLLTGRYAAHTGVTGVTGRKEVMRADEVTIAEVFSKGGYVTGCFGKWHNGEQYPNHPLGQGFGEFFGFCGGHWNNYFDPMLEQQGRMKKAQGYITDVITDAAIEFIGTNRERSFFCYVPYNAPHSPWQVSDELFDKYTSRGFDPETATAYGMIENLDGAIGRILATLDDQRLAENTIVVFLTDNGPNGRRYNGGMRGAKGSVHEGGVRVPCFICWPKSLAPREVTPTAAHIDLLPTLAELCDIDLPQTRPLDGVSLAPLLRGAKAPWPDRTLITYRPTRGFVRGAARNQRYRFVRERGGDQLYNMQKDPAQKKNLAGEAPRVLAKMRAAYEQFVDEVEQGAARPKPIPVGYAEAPQVELPAVEASLRGGVRFMNVNGYAHDWITNWKETGDAVTWRLDVEQDGRYEVILSYACSEKNAGSTVHISAGGASFEGIIDEPFDKGKFARPERSQHRGPRWMREFHAISLGEIDLRQGEVELTLRATDIAGASVCELDAVRLRRVR